jgi:hypothetical protein
MKTSFAKTFKDFSKGEDSKDLVYKNRVSTRVISDNINSISPDNVFVIEPYVEKYESESQSTLLGNEKLRTRHNNAMKNIDAKKKVLLGKLSTLSGIKKHEDIENTICSDFANNDFYTVIKKISEAIPYSQVEKFSSIPYRVIINDKTLKILGSPNVESELRLYMEKYDELIENTKYLKRGFDHTNVQNVHKSLKDNKFFEANHSVILNSKDQPTVIDSEVDLNKIIDDEMKSVLSDDVLKTRWELVEKNFTNEESRQLRILLDSNKDIIRDLVDISKLKKNLWGSYLSVQDCSVLCTDYLNTFDEMKVEIAKIVAEAKIDAPTWTGVLNIFNTRFSVPFRLDIQNKSDVVLNESKPILTFTYSDRTGECVEIDEDSIIRILSQGEKRALYILNIIFEVEVRRLNNRSTLFVIDDVADSFDYKNKYAIIEYLHDMANVQYFSMIILTHNFDFFRTMKSRLGIPRNHNLSPIKTIDRISLEIASYQGNPYPTWVSKLPNDKRCLLASIPFVRNISEHTENSDSYRKLTSLLHIKPDTYTVTVQDLLIIYDELRIKTLPSPIPNSTDKVFDIISIEANSIGQADIHTAMLEEKLILSIWIRLKAEQYMIAKINDPTKIMGITKYQTAKLYNEFKSMFSAESIELGILHRVILMTPENIHVNSFMYEPILDMDIDHLKVLLKDVNALQ